MYTIIGGDGKQYGPISEADLGKWIAEGRLNALSMAKAESDAEFRPLSTFPEFAHLFGVPAAISGGIAPPLGGGHDGRDAAAQKVKVPAIGLIISSSVSLLFALYGLATISSTAAKMQQLESRLADNPQAQQMIQQMAHFFSGPFGVANIIFQIIISVLILIGSIKMLNLKSYEFAYAAAILAVIPCITPCCGWILGLIFGIWAMVVLGKAKSNFS